MTRFVRLSYLAPRLIALAFCYIAIELLAGALLHRAATVGLTASLNAETEVKRASVSLNSASGLLQGVTVDHSHHLLEADSVELDLETQPMLMRRLVIENAKVKGLRIGSPRSEQLAPEPTIGAPGRDAMQDATPLVDRLASDWSRRLEERLGRDLQAEFRSPQIAYEMSIQWPERYEQTASKTAALRADADRFRADASRARRNPLRNIELIDSMPSRATSLQERMDSLSAELDSLPRELDEDRRRLAEARRRDEKLIRRTLGAGRLDADAMTEALLGEQLNAPIEELIAWIRWTRTVAPAVQLADRTTPRARGIDVHFGASAPRPGVLVRSVELYGTAQLAGRPTELRGLVTNLSSAPSRQIAPTRVVIESTDGVPMSLTATIDRSSKKPVDEVLFDCPVWLLPGRSLHAGESFTLKLDPAVATLNARIRVEGERLRGGVQLVQERTRVRASQESLTAELTRELDKRPRVATRVTLSGTLARPGVALSSTLGKTLSEAIEAHAQQLLTDQRERMQASLSEQIDHRLATLNELVGAQDARIATELAGPLSELRGLAADWTDTQGASYERIGHQLPAGSLFR